MVDSWTTVDIIDMQMRNDQHNRGDMIETCQVVLHHKRDVLGAERSERGAQKVGMPGEIYIPT